MKQPDPRWTDTQQIATVLDFWFGFDESDPTALKQKAKRWFSGGAETDRDITANFAELFVTATNGHLTAWEVSPRGRLPLIIVLDQFSRNLHRGHADAFRHDPKAQQLTLAGISAGADRELSAIELVFFYMPLQHAESIELQNESVLKFETLAQTSHPSTMQGAFEGFADFARLHRDIIAEFGRFPYRNAVLGRTSTQAEREFLAAGGPSFGQ